MAFRRIVNGPNSVDDVNQIIKAWEGDAGAGNPLLLTQVEDAANYVADIRNLDSTNGYLARFRDYLNNVVLSIVKGGVTINQDVTVASGKLIDGVDVGLHNHAGGTYGTQVLITGLSSTAFINQGWNNELYKGDFEDWPDGTSVAPRDWTLSGAAAAVARATGVWSTYGAQVTSAAALSILYQDVATYVRYKARQVTFGAWVVTSSASKVRLSIGDGVGVTYSSYHTGGGSTEWLSVTRTIDTSATRLRAGLEVEATSIVAIIDGAVMVEGPLHPSYVQHIDDKRWATIPIIFTAIDALYSNAGADTYEEVGAYQSLTALVRFTIDCGRLPPNPRAILHTVQRATTAVAATVQLYNTTDAAQYTGVATSGAAYAYDYSAASFALPVSGVKTFTLRAKSAAAEKCYVAKAWLEVY